MSELTTHESTVNSFYLAFFGRPADPEGLAFWSGHLADNNGDYRFITEAFATSEEARVRFGDDTAAERIAEIYQQLFNRAPDATGLAYWTGVLEQGHASPADVAIAILGGAQGSDASLVALREGAVADFTARVAETGSDYSGYAAVEAARVLARAVTAEASSADIAKLVQATVAFADIASTNPAVIDAIATGSTLLALFDTPRGLLDPVTLAQALADVAKAAAGNPATLESLLRGGGMDQVLKVMPARATLQDVVDALAEGGLPAAIDVVYPPSTPTPTPTPVAIQFASVEQGPLDRAPTDKVTNVEHADVTFTYTGTVRAGQQFEYSIDGGKSWSTDKLVSGNGVIAIADVDLTLGMPEGLNGPQSTNSNGFATFDAPQLDNLLTTVQVRLAGASQQPAPSASATVTLDRFTEIHDVELPANPTAIHFGPQVVPHVNSTDFGFDGLEPGAIIQYLNLSNNGANMVTWTDTMPELVDGLYTFRVRQLDAAGNRSSEQEFSFVLDRSTLSTPTIHLADDTGIDTGDGITSDSTIVIEGLSIAQYTGWQYSVDGTNWKFGGLNDGSGSATLEIVDLDSWSGTLQVRQVNLAGTVSSASSALDFEFDDIAPNDTLSFVRIEGEADNVQVTTSETVDLTFGLDGNDGGIVQWRFKGESDWTTVGASSFNGDGTFTLSNIDLSQADPTIQLQVIDEAGNVGDHDSWTIDGPAGVSVKATVRGLEVTSSASGDIFLGSFPVLPDNPHLGAIDGTVLVGNQGTFLSGNISVVSDAGPTFTYDTGIVFTFGGNGGDKFGGTNLWGFDGDDTLTGTIGDDFISGGTGRDFIESRGGSDIISGGQGGDTITLTVDGRGSTLLYDTKETFVGRFFDDTVLPEMDRISGAEAGDVISVGDIFQSGPVTVSDTYLDADDSGHVAVVRGNLAQSGSRFVASDTGSAYMVQWVDGIGINSIVLNSFASGVLDLEIDRVNGTLTMVSAPVVGTFDSVDYAFSRTASSFVLEGMSAPLERAATYNGLMAGFDFSLRDFRTGSAIPFAHDYTSGPAFGVDGDGNVDFSNPLKTGVYQMIWTDKTFQVEGGALEAGRVSFAGGVEGNIVQQGFALDSYFEQSFMQLGATYMDNRGSSLSLLYRAAEGVSSDVHTGLQRDVIDVEVGKVKIHYSSFAKGSEDLIIGFGYSFDNRIVFEGAAGTLVDKNENGDIEFVDADAQFALNASHEMANIGLDGEFASDGLETAGSATLQTLNDNINVSGLTIGDSLLIFGADTSGGNAGGSVLLHYIESNGNGEIDAGEATLVAVFTGSSPSVTEIEVVGTASP